MFTAKKVTLLATVATILIVAGGIMLVLTTRTHEEGNLKIRNTQENSTKQGGILPRHEEKNTLTSELNTQEQTNPAPAAISREYTGPGLQLPFNTSDIDGQNGEVNPLGVVRFDKDQADIGHSGIDIPLFPDAPILAAASGEIVIIKTAGDPWGGQGIFQLIEPGIEGEGWVYIYEHVTPRAGLKVGDTIRVGEQIATKTPPTGFTAHFQMSYAFNNYEFTRAMVCWVDYLEGADINELFTWWEKYSSSNTLVNAWRTNDEDGKFPFRGLLDTSQFPNGPQLCYPLGTDVR